MDPQVAFAISSRLPHLGIRMAEHGRRAMAFAERLHALGLQVGYPGLPSHRDHDLLLRMANPGFGMGGLLTLDLGTACRAERLMECLQNEQQFGYMAVSLGYYDTLMSCSAVSTSSEMPPDRLANAGISPGLLRMSVGFTGSLEQRWSQLETALRTTGVLEEARMGA